MWCIVNLPNGTQRAVKCDSKTPIGQECLEKVCKALDMCCETEYFGLEYWEPNQKECRPHHWLNLRNPLSLDGSRTRLSRDGSGGGHHHLMLALRVKFWVPVHSILQDNVRDIFYMQAKSDLLEGRLNAKDWNNAATLGALLCQADGIRFNEACLTAKCPEYIKQDLKDKKEKEPSLAKKRRLSQQKSLDSINVAKPTELLLSSQTSPLDIKTSPLQIYEAYQIGLNESNLDAPKEFLKQIARKHEKLSKSNMSPKSAKYRLLNEIESLLGFGKEHFTGVTTNENSVRCDISVGTQELVVCTGEDKMSISFSTITTAKSYRRIFKLEYMDDFNRTKELEVKLPKNAIAADLYRAITERHAFYVCAKVQDAVTNQFTRDLKGTIASMFKEDTDLGKRYVFDIQRTSREVYDHARRVLYNRNNGAPLNTEQYLPSLEASGCDNAVDDVIKANEDREATIERCVDDRISEAMSCKICMDKEINTLLSPCGHVCTCSTCAAKCDQCPICRQKITKIEKLYLPPELRINSPTP